MKSYTVDNFDETSDALIQSLEMETGKKIFTMRVIGENNNGLETITIFEDKSVLLGSISIRKNRTNLLAEVKGDWI